MKKINIQSNINLKAAVAAATETAVAADVKVANATATLVAAEAAATETAGTLARTAVQFRTFINNFVVEGGEYRSFMGICSDVGVTHPDLVKWVRKQKWEEVFAIWNQGSGYTRNSFRTEEDWETYLQLREGFLEAQKANKKASRKLAKAKAALKAAQKEAIPSRFAEKSAKKAYGKARKEVKNTNAAKAVVAAEENRQERARKRAEKSGPKEPPKRREVAVIAGLESMIQWIEARKAGAETAAQKAAVEVATTETVVATETTKLLVVEANKAVQKFGFETGYVDPRTGEFVAKNSDPLFKGQSVHFKTGTTRPVLNGPIAGDNVGGSLNKTEDNSEEKGFAEKLGGALLTGREELRDIEIFLGRLESAVAQDLAAAQEVLKTNAKAIRKGSLDKAIIESFRNRAGVAQERVDKLAEKAKNLAKAISMLNVPPIELTEEDLKVVRDPQLVHGDRFGFRAVMGSKPQVAIPTIILDGSDVENTSGEGLRAISLETETGISHFIRAAIDLQNEKGWGHKLVTKGGHQRFAILKKKAHVMDRNGKLVELNLGTDYTTTVTESMKYRVRGLLVMKIAFPHRIDNVPEYERQIRLQDYIIVDGVKYVPLVVESNAKTRLFFTIWTAVDLKDYWEEVMNNASGYIGLGLLTENDLARAYKKKARLSLSMSPSWKTIIDFKKHGVVIINDTLDHIDGQAWCDDEFMGSLVGAKFMENGFQVRTSTSKGQAKNTPNLQETVGFLEKFNGYKKFVAFSLPEVRDIFEQEGEKVMAVVGNEDNIVLVGDMNFWKDIPRERELDKNGQEILTLNILKNAAPTGNGGSLAYQAIVGACCQYLDDNGKSYVRKEIMKAIYEQAIATFESYFDGQNVPSNMNEMIAAIVGKGGLKGNAPIIAELAMKGGRVALKQIEGLYIKLKNEQHVVLGDAELNYNKSDIRFLFSKHRFLRDGIECTEGPGLMITEVIVPDGSPLLRHGNKRIIMLRYPHGNGFSFVMADLVTVSQAVRRIKNSTLEDDMKTAIIKEVKAIHGKTIMTDGSREVKEALGGMDFDIDEVAVLTEEEYERLLPIDEMKTIIAPINTKAIKKELPVLQTANLQERLAELQKESAKNSTIYVGQVNGTVLICTEFPAMSRKSQNKVRSHFIKENNLKHNGELPVFDYKQFIKYSDSGNGIMLADECTTIEAMEKAVDAFISTKAERNYSIESIVNFCKYVILMSGPCQGFIIDTVKKACATIHLGKELTYKVALGYKKFKAEYKITLDDIFGKVVRKVSARHAYASGWAYADFGAEMQKVLFRAFKMKTLKYVLDVFSAGDDKLNDWTEFDKSMKNPDQLLNVDSNKKAKNKKLRDLAGRAATCIDFEDKKIQKAFESDDIDVPSILNAWGPALASTAMLWGTINSTLLNSHKVAKYLRPLELKAALQAAGITHVPVKLAFIHQEAIDYAKEHVGQVLDFEKDADEMAIECMNCPGLLLPAGYKGGKYEIAEKITARKNKSGEISASRQLYAMVEAHKALSIQEFDSSKFVAQMSYPGKDPARAEGIIEKVETMISTNAHETILFAGSWNDAQSYIQAKDAKRKERDLANGGKGDQKSYTIESARMFPIIKEKNTLNADSRCLLILEFSERRNVARISFLNRLDYGYEARANSLLCGPVNLCGHISEVGSSQWGTYYNTYLLLERKDQDDRKAMEEFVKERVDAYAEDFRANVLTDAIRLGSFGKLLESKLVKANEEDILPGIPNWFVKNKGTDQENMVNAAGLLGLGYDVDQVEALYGPLPEDLEALTGEDLAAYAVGLFESK